MSLNRYSMIVLGVLFITLACAWPIALRRLDSASRWAVASGAGVAALNTTVAYGLVRWSAGRSTTAFLRAVLGGMFVRMAFMLAALVAGILLLDLPRLPLVISLLAYFVLFLAMELTFFQRGSGASAGATR